MLAAPVAALGRSVLGWVGLVVVAATAVAALFTAFPQHGDRGRRGRLPDVLLAVQAVATVVTVTTLPVDVSLWLWVLLGSVPRRGRAPLVGTVGDHRHRRRRRLLARLRAGLGRRGRRRLHRPGLGLRDVRLLPADRGRRRAPPDPRPARRGRGPRGAAQRMSRDLHDLLGHSLSLIVVKAEAVRRIGPRDPDAVVTHAQDIEAIGRQALAEVRRTVAGYRGDGLAEELASAEESLAAPPESPPSSTAPTRCRRSVAADATLGWVVREAVTNVLRHARAIVVPHHHVRRERPRRLSVADDGVGWTQDGRRLRAYLVVRYARSRRARPGRRRHDARSRREPGHGTRVTAWVPPRRRHPPDTPVDAQAQSRRRSARPPVIRLLLAEDQGMMRSALATLLGWRTTSRSSARSSTAARDRARRAGPPTRRRAARHRVRGRQRARRRRDPARRGARLRRRLPHDVRATGLPAARVRRRGHGVPREGRSGGGARRVRPAGPRRPDRRRPGPRHGRPVQRREPAHGPRA